MSTPVILCMGEVEPREVSWLWPRRIPAGRITLFAGAPGDGKSFATADFAARVSTGREWPDGAACERGSVLLLAGEDDVGDRERRLFLPGKSNLAPRASGLSFTIGGEPASIRWEPEPVRMTADEPFAAIHGDRRVGRPSRGAAEWLAVELADGPRRAKDLVAAWTARGGTKRTLQRARASLGVEAIGGRAGRFGVDADRPT
ncbi:MAG: hypothetical protein FJ297_17490 [Planctomycetes bacterium]|nr:hypothetical protein [Planctomycetota bacterium]